MRIKKYLAAGGAAAMAVTAFAAVPANAVQVGDDGCTPGYWKNHTENWQEYQASDTLGGDIRPGAQEAYFALGTTFAAYENTTFSQALALKGGPGLDGAFQILMRATTAAFLNAAYDDLGDDPMWDGYPYRRFADTNDPADTVSPILDSVNAALTSGSRDQMLALAATLDAANNLGCPLN